MQLVHRSRSLAEKKALYLVAALFAVAWIAVAAGASIAQSADFHLFADQRSLLTIPHAMDVLSNLPFALIGLVGLWGETRADQSDFRRLMALTFAGLLTTFLGSSYYHWAPSDFGLAVDRLGMSIAFAGVLGIAASTVSVHLGHRLAIMVLVMAPAAVGLAYWSGNLLVWVLLQGGGLLALLIAGITSKRGLFSAADWFWIVGFYVLAKMAEMADHPIYELTEHLLSGHSLKHLLAAVALLPLLRAVNLSSSVTQKNEPK